MANSDGPFQNLGAAQPIGDVMNNYVYGPIHRVLGAINKVPLPEDAHQKFVDQMNKQSMDQAVQDANKSFIPTQTMAQKKTAAPVNRTAKVNPKASPRKKGM